MPDNDLFIDILHRSDMSKQVFIGMRGCGKTYSGLKGLTLDTNNNYIYRPDKFIYMRHTQKQIDICSSAAGNPFKRINKDCGTDIYPKAKKSESTTYFYDRNITLRQNRDIANVLGYGVALSTFGNMRGSDFSDVDTIIFDEFIDQSSRIQKLTANSGTDLKMFMETVLRNDEILTGKKLKIYLLANAITLDSPILLELGIVKTIASMLATGQSRATLKEKDTYVEIIQSKKLRELKGMTSLYSSSDKNSIFVKQALYNSFANVDYTLIRNNVPLHEYENFIRYGDILCIYRHKSRSEYYITQRSLQTCAYTFPEQMLDVMQEMFSYLYKRLFVSRSVYYDSFATKIICDGYFL